MNHSHYSPSNLLSERRPGPLVHFNRPRLIIPVCHHILQRGRLCRGPARRGQRFCRHHADLRVRRLRAGRAEREIRLAFTMPPLPDMPAIQRSRAKIRYAMAAGRLEPATVRMLFWALRMAIGNIRYLKEQAHWDREEKSHDRRPASKPFGQSALSPSSSIKYTQTLGTQTFASRYMVSS
jgi:hypothetical protein